MKYYPICLEIKNRPCLVVGGGRVGARKVKTLLACGARVTVVSPAITDELAGMAAAKQIAVRKRPYRSSDMDGVFLVIGATDDENQNRRIHRDAENAKCLCNIADQPRLCNFILPSVISQGDLLITVSTSGSSPAFAKHLRQRLQGWFGPEYQQFLSLMAAIRERMLTAEHDPEAHKALFEKLIQSELLSLIKQADIEAVDQLLINLLGQEYRYHELMKSKSPFAP